jgi:hypothetical protein
MEELECEAVGCNLYLKKIIESIHNKTFLFKNKEERENYIKGIEDLITSSYNEILEMNEEEIKKTDIRFLKFYIPLFNLSYYGLNIKNICLKLVNLYKLIFNHIIEKVNNKYKIVKGEIEPKRDNRLKICFISDRLGGLSSVSRDRGLLIHDIALNKEKFITGIMSDLKNPDDYAKNYLNKVDILHNLNDDLFFNINILGCMRYDILIFADCHMSPQVSTISLFRLAPFMINTFGHSETSGTCDFFISSRVFENEENEKNYTEKLILCDSLNMKYPNIINPDTFIKFKPRAFFEMPNNKPIIIIPSSLFKIGGDFLLLINEILNRNKEVFIIFIKMSEAYDIPFYEKLQEYINPDNFPRVCLKNRLDLFNMYNVLYLSTLMIDTLPFGCLNTTIEALTLGLPVLTLPTNKLNGRFSQGIINYIGMPELIADDEEDLINKALYIIENPDYRKNLNEKILTSKDKIFLDNSTVEEWINKILNVDFLKSL